MYRIWVITLLLIGAVAYESYSLTYKPSDFAAIDERALSVPDSAKESLKSLTLYLIADAKTDLQKFRAIWRWITDNIAYDSVSFENGVYPDADPEATFASGMGVCEGYSRLFLQMAKYAGLSKKTVQVSGVSKGGGYVPGAGFTDRDGHAWNAVQLEGKWYLLDSTWGAGIVNNGTFEKQYNEHYFLTPPEWFIFDHFPETKKWQLLKKPITLEDFEQLYSPTPSYFHYGLQVTTHKKVSIDMGSRVRISLKASSDMIFLAGVSQDGTPMENQAFVQRDGQTVNVDIAVADAGTYQFSLYAKKRTEEGVYPEVLRYQLVASEGAGDEAYFPMAYDAFATRDCVLYSPMQGKIASGSKAKFKIKVPNAIEVQVIVDGKWLKLTKGAGSVFSGNIAIEGSEIGIYAKFPDTTDYSGLLVYQGI